VNPQERQTLESLVDKYSLAQVIENLAEICYGKAEHLRTNWQDEQSAKYWERNGKRLDRLTATNTPELK
jgi:hypothetical protein